MQIHRRRNRVTLDSGESPATYDAKPTWDTDLPQLVSRRFLSPPSRPSAQTLVERLPLPGAVLRPGGVTQLQGQGLVFRGLTAAEARKAPSSWDGARGLGMAQRKGAENNRGGSSTDGAVVLPLPSGRGRHWGRFPERTRSRGWSLSRQRVELLLWEEPKGRPKSPR